MSANGTARVETAADDVGIAGAVRKWVCRSVLPLFCGFSLPYGGICRILAAWRGKRVEQRPHSGRHGLCPDRRHQRSDPDDVHDPFEIVGQYVQGHFGADIFEPLHQEVG